MVNSLITQISNKRKEEYSTTYNRLMARGAGRKYEKGVHERHHIIPLSTGGSNEKSNIVSLTFREHFLAHWLLTKFYEGVNSTKMLCAFGLMTRKSKDNTQRIISGWQFKKAREAKATAMLGNNYGIGYKHTKEALEKISMKSKGNKYTKGKQHQHRYTREQCLARSKQMIGNKNGQGNKGKIVSNETRIKIGNSCRGSKSANSRKIICLNDGKMHLAMSEAANFYGIKYQSISRVCRGVKKSTKGLQFSYVESAA